MRNTASALAVVLLLLCSSAATADRRSDLERKCKDRDPVACENRFGIHSND